jgi:ribosome modulation factor
MEETEEMNGTAVATERSESDCILDRIWNAELIVRLKETTVEELKEELKEARAEYDEAVKALRRLAQAKNESRPLFGGIGGDGGVDAPSTPKPIKSSIEPTSTEWRDEPIETLLQPPIAGMGAKKVELLADTIATLGDFEDLRSKVGRDADTLAKLLPKGFGEKMVDELENRQLEYIASFQKVGSQPVESSIEPNPEPEQITNSNDPELDDHERQLLTRLSALDPGTEEDWTQWKHDSDCWQNGFDAGNEGEEVGVCIYTAGEKQDDWLRGWAAANSEWEEEEIDDPEVEESQPEPEENPIDETTTTVTNELDEL